MSVKRYSVMGSTWTMPKDDGEYVKHEDYTTLETEHKSAMLTISAIMGMLGVADAGSISEQVAALLKEREALAVENVALKSSQGEIYSYTQQFTNSDDREMWNAMHDIYKLSSPLETPATDAAIAKIQAQGVEKFAEWNDRHIANGDEHEDTLKEVGRAARLFAFQLRKEATHD